MFRKILFFLLFANMSVYAQKSQPDHEWFDISIDKINVDTKFVRDAEDPDFYIVCKDKRVNIKPKYQTQYLRKTDVYQMEPLAYEPYEVNPALNGGTEVEPNVTSWHDSRTSCPIELPFKFCFFNQTFDKVHVWSNGAISFTQSAACTVPAPYISYIYQVATGPIPQGFTGDPLFMNTIFVALQHTHWDKTVYPYGSINYQVYGTAPDRKFVISWFDMPTAGLNQSACPPPTPLQNHQVVLHESTNVIDVNIIHHENCPFGDTSEDDHALIGIINHNGTVAYAPPGRNQDSWSATGESWRFAPAGDCGYRTQWDITDSKGTVTEIDMCEGEIDLVIDELKTIKATLTVEICGGTYQESYTIKVRPAIEIDKVDLEHIVCDKNQHTYDLNLFSKEIKDNQSASQAEINKLRFTYYKSEDDALNKVNTIRDIREYPIVEVENPLFIRIEYSELEECFEILPAMIIKAPVEVVPKLDVYICEKYTLPVLTNDEFYLKMERLDENASYVVQTINDINENLEITKHGYYRVYVKKTNKYGCEDIKSFLLMVENCSYPKGLSPNGDGDNDYLDLTYSNVQEIKIYNRHGKLVYNHGKGYKREWRGQDNNDKVLPSGTYFINVKTLNYEYQDWIQLMYEVK